ncbi:MAG: ankyrin repeat domain-containing protein [Flavobacteriaceae bacterium]|jgi:ankyrin repeat protein|nr:ankyrin repeat domain-containing protein [Flavobacteriaceae bacterium]
MKTKGRITLLFLMSLIGGSSIACSDTDDIKSKEEEVMILEKSIYKVIEDNNLQEVEQLILNKVNLEQRNAKEETPLMYAVYLKRNAIAKVLMQAGANVNAQDKILNSPFLYAGAEGNIELVKEALKYGADFTVFNRYYGTALIPAAEKGHIEVVKLLVNYPNYPIDHVNRLGWTALMEAIVLGNGGEVHIRIVDELIKGGVNVSIPDFDGVTPLQHAQKRNYKAIIDLLIKAGAN